MEKSLSLLVIEIFKESCSGRKVKVVCRGI